MKARLLRVRRAVGDAVQLVREKVLGHGTSPAIPQEGKALTSGNAIKKKKHNMLYIHEREA